MSKRMRPPESLGWIFWLICFVVLMGPCVYLALGASYEGVNPSGPIMLGLLAASMLAGLVSWIANGLLQLRARRTRAKQSSREGLHSR